MASASVMTNTHLLSAWAALLGVVSHWTFFIRGEHHMRAPLYGCVFIALIPALYFLQLHLNEYDTFKAVEAEFGVFAAYLLSLFTSMTVYRLFFHRLRHFPGPLGFRISKLWHSWKTRRANNHLVLDQLYHEYGTFVRTGPNEVTIFSPEALTAMTAPGNTFTRTDWADSIHPLKSVGNVRDPVVHERRRRVWDQAFSIKAVRNYEGRITKYGAQLDQLLMTKIGQPVDVYDIFSYYTSDVMGDLAFGKPFNNILGDKLHISIQGVRDFMGAFGPISPIPWIFRLASPLLMQCNGWQNFMDFTKKKMNTRIMAEPAVPDISSYLISSSIEKGTLEEDREFLHGDALILIIIGSDSMATTLINTFASLVRHPKYQDIVRAELRGVSSMSDFAAITDLPILKSIIVETLRLWPPIPTLSGRTVGKGGITIAGKFVPEGTTIFGPRYTIARLESCFEQPNQFIPERWTSKPEMVKDKRAYAPFSSGRHNCVGQRLAMDTVTHLAALLISKYEITFAPGEDGTAVIRDMQDNYTQNPGRLRLVFKLREKEAVSL